MAKIECPHCKRTHEVPGSVLGKKVRCNDCQESFVATEVVAPISAVQAAAVAPPPTPRVKKPSGAGFSDFMDKVKGAFFGAKRRVRATKLKFDIKGIHRAIIEQRAKLGALALQHQPPGLDVAAEAGEIEQIDTELAEKQSTLDTLRQSKGSGAVVKEMRQEVNQLKTRQQTLQVAAGEKADTARVDFGGASAHYAAIDRLQQSLAAMESESAELATETGSESSGGGSSGGSSDLVRWLAIGGGAIVGLIVVWFIGSFLLGLVFGGSRLDAYMDYIPDNTKGIEYSDFAVLRDCFPDKKDEFSKAFGRVNAKVDADDCEEAFSLSLDPGGLVQIIRTGKDFEIKDFIDVLGDEQEYKGQAYFRTEDRSFAAKTEKRTFCIARNEDALKRVIATKKKGEKPDLDEALEEVLSYVGDKDSFRASIRSGGSLKATGTGMSFGSTISFEMVEIYKDKEDAEEKTEKAEEERKEELEEVDRKLENASGDEKKKLEVQRRMMKNASVKQSGNVVRARFSVDKEDFETLGPGRL